MTLNKLKALGIALLLGVAPAGPVYATADLVVDRGLPIININDAAGADRSNIAWGGYPTGTAADTVFWLTGDTFRMPDLSAGQQWTIDTIRIWSPAIPDGNAPSGNPYQLGDIYDSITLYAGAYEDRPRANPLPELSTGNITGNTSDNPHIQFTRVYYNNNGTTNFQGQTADYQIWQVDFTHLNWVVDPLTLIEFGIDAMGDDFWYNHASNAALSGSPQQGANGWFSQINAGDLMEIYDCDSGVPADAAFCGWDKSSDINVQVFATPAPGSLALALGGLFGLFAARSYRGAGASPAQA